MNASKSSPRFWLGGFVALLFACSAPADLHEPLGTSEEAIVGGVAASSYPEAALVDMYQSGQLGAYCSGSIIAPQVVLTAGHCVTGEVSFQPDSWVVTAPYNGKQKAKATNALTYDWKVNYGTVSPNLHDVGLIFLDTPIMISPSQCPVISDTELPDNTQIVNLGRIKNGTLSKTDLFVSPPLSVVDGSGQGYPYDYSGNDVIESGDSGGPDELLNASPHVIVSVNSGGGSDEVLARTDPTVVYQWIQMEIAAHGGGCTSAAADSGAGADASAADAAPESAAPEAAAPEAAASPPVDATAGNVAVIEASAPTLPDTDATTPADQDGGGVLPEEAGQASNADNPLGTFPPAAASCSCHAAGHGDSAPVHAILGCGPLLVAAARRRRYRPGPSLTK